MFKFVKSYLQDRQKHVVDGGDVSNMLPVQSGVPQAAILGGGGGTKLHALL